MKAFRFSLNIKDKELIERLIKVKGLDIQIKSTIKIHDYDYFKKLTEIKELNLEMKSLKICLNIKDRRILRQMMRVKGLRLYILTLLLEEGISMDEVQELVGDIYNVREITGCRR